MIVSIRYKAIITIALYCVGSFECNVLVQSKPPNGPSFNQNPLLNVQNGPSANFFPQPVANPENGNGKFE